MNQRKFELREGKATLNTEVIDLTNNASEVIPIISKHLSSADFIICNLAIHYLFYNAQTLQNVFDIVDTLLEIGGKFLFTCFDGQTVFNKLNGNTTVDFLGSDGQAKYSIKKLYESNKFEKYGQKISVKLPFTGNEYYEEYLVNIDNIIDFFQKRGYCYEKNFSFGNYLDRFKYHNPDIYNKLTLEDKEFVKLYSYVSLTKMKSIKKTKIKS